MSWQSIETAPSTRGYRLLAWCVYPAGAEARICQNTPPYMSPEGTTHWEAYGIKQNATHWMDIPSGPDRRGTEVTIPPPIKPLEWRAKKVDGATYYSGFTLLGEFVYGTDLSGQPYYQGPLLERDCATEAQAKKEAEAYYAALANEFVEDAFEEPIGVAEALVRLIEQRPGPIPDRQEIVAEMRALIAKATCVEAGEE